MAKATLPPETCEECGKEIKGTARANVFDNRIVCTPCWNRLDVERQWHGPATDRQVAYARDLGLHFPADITKLEMADLLTRNLEYEDEPAAPHSMLERAASLGVRNVTRYAGRRQLYDRVFKHLRNTDDGLLATWFVENVAREMGARIGAAAPEVVQRIARELAGIPQVMKSLKRYNGSDLLTFGDWTDAEGWIRRGGSRDTIAYKAARERLTSALGR